jgi:DNA-binding MarR family transcriptional regulator
MEINMHKKVAAKNSAVKSDNTENRENTGINFDSRLEILKKLRVVIRAAQQHSLWIEKQCGVNGAQLWMMQELHDAAGLRVGELAKKLAIHQTTTSNLLDNLEKRAYIQKTRDPDDKRAVRLSLTATGLALLMGAPKPARGLLPEALLHLDTEIMEKLNVGLQGLVNSIEVVDEGFALLPLPFTM